MFDSLLDKLKHRNSRFNKYIKYIPIVLILFIAFSLRFINLGYSDFQGDEIKALFIPETGQSVTEFLLTQRKGPMQFIVTFVLQLLDPNYTNQFLIRFPFALAGFLAVYYFYKFVKNEFDEKVAFYASFFFATNGFFVAFSRIVQYQSFVILFMVMSLYFFSLASKSKEYNFKGLYLGFLFWALSMLSHYDGLFIFPYVGYLIFRWGKAQIFNFRELFGKFTITKPLKHLVLSSLIALILVLVFYLPFVFNIDPGTKSYWLGRLAGTGGKISSSKYLFSVYQPIYVVHIYLLLFVFGFVEVLMRFVGLELLLSVLKVKPKALATLALVLFKDYFLRAAALTVWAFIPFLFMEAVVDIPGTHIYTYLVPVFVFLAFGVLFIERLLFLIFKHFSYILSFIGVGTVFLFIFLQSYMVFVDHAQEYPWQSEKFLFWEFPEPTPIFHLSMFGFPYYRHWEEIADFVNNEDALIPCPKNKEIIECPFKLGKIRYYSTNERSSISRYHIPFTKDTDNAGYYIYIKNPQSFTNEILNDKAAYWSTNYEPAKSFKNCPEDISTGNFSDIFGLHTGNCNSEMHDVSHVYYMVNGKLDLLQKAGF